MNGTTKGWTKSDKAAFATLLAYAKQLRAAVLSNPRANIEDLTGQLVPAFETRLEGFPVYRRGTYTNIAYFSSFERAEQAAYRAIRAVS